MIVFCDFNPKLTRSYKVVDFVKNSENVYSESRTYASGYGIDMLTFLMQLGDRPRLITFLGGQNGVLIRENLDAVKADYDFIKIKDESSEEILIKSRSLKTIVRSKLPRITTEDEENLYTMFAREISFEKFVCIPQNDSFIRDELYESLIKLCYKEGIKVAVVVTELENLKNSKPYMMIVDKEQLEYYTNLKIKTQTEVVSAAGVILDSGTGIIIVNSEKGCVIVTKNKSYGVNFEELKYSVSRINKNLMLAAIAFGIEREYDFETTIKLGIASSIIENFIKFRMITMADIKKIMAEIELKEII
ncbi:MULTISPECIES: PfkB family carbohydrate kinase [Peptoniphilus]|uniref:PfkB family carbohydrate kinase n=1 Tax=Peptoniphilus TaxID=162289 RepID=UPI0001DA9CCA|nr:MULTISPECIES: PfkB family carbohydrate kinase [Peptoniphilus]EFI42669.1 hypothetical protein HMPREF0629_01330 [Peptoniphilus sp. oral taxon 386 str. F0131]